MRVIGTAGHVDHGKSTLIEALTGIHPDRLREEREREMTIVLGFAWMTLPNGEEIGIVDVPGHRDFIENMLSGVGAIDAALFVVAADEGVMPQTREHLAILDLLQIQGGVIAITKADLVDDAEWLDLVEADVRETVAGTVLDSAPLVRVSAHTGQGLDELKHILARVLADRPPRPDLGRPRLSVDRAFTVAGFGTVVTGTLTDGHLTIGDEVVILPGGLRGRVRGLQTHKKKEQTAVPGSRTAINISGVDLNQIQRGDVVTRPGDYFATRRLDLYFNALPEITQPLRHDMEAKLFIGASEVYSRVRLLGTDVLRAGESGWLQLELRRPVVAIRGDRFILRRPSPGETLGGGVVVDPQPRGRHKRYDAVVLERLEALIHGDPADILLQALHTLGVATLNELVERSSLENRVAHQAFEQLRQGGDVLVISGAQEELKPNELLISRTQWEDLTRQVVEQVEQYHQAYPLRQGMPREELKSRLRLAARPFNLILAKLIRDGVFETTQIRENLPGVSAVPVVYKPGHEIRFTSEQERRVGRLMEKFAKDPFSPPTIKTCIADVGEGVYNALIDLGRLMPVSAEVVFRWEDYQRLVRLVRDILEEEGVVSVARMRDQLKTSRRYVLAFLEHLDAIGVTVRDGDVRRLKT